MKWFASRKREEGDPPDFTGKAVVIYWDSEGGGGVFEDVSIVQIGFSPFVVGRQAACDPHDRGKRSKVTCWFSINEVRQMRVYDDIEAARLAYERAVRYPWLPTEPDPPAPE